MISVGGLEFGLCFSLEFYRNILKTIHIVGKSVFSLLSKTKFRTINAEKMKFFINSLNAKVAII